MSQRIKYPRTFHLPGSPGATSDDKVLPSVDHFEGKLVVITEKMDGENTTLYRDYLHARSKTYSPHPSRDWIRRYHAELREQIPAGWRICGENLFACHSIHYRNLDSYFLGFSIWDDENRALGWEETLEWFALLGIRPVPEIYRGPFNHETLDHQSRLVGDSDDIEGYVVRLEAGFHYSRFKESVAKYVRPGHVQTESHWITQPVVKNMLRTDERRRNH